MMSKSRLPQGYTGIHSFPFPFIHILSLALLFSAGDCVLLEGKHHIRSLLNPQRLDLAEY